MGQISIQLDAATLKLLERTAARNRVSVSKWVKSRIQGGLKQEWPEDYFSVFGTLAEGELSEPPEIPFSYETRREDI